MNEIISKTEIENKIHCDMFSYVTTIPKAGTKMINNNIKIVNLRITYIFLHAVYHASRTVGVITNVYACYHVYEGNRGVRLSCIIFFSLTDIDGVL